MSRVVSEMLVVFRECGFYNDGDQEMTTHLEKTRNDEFGHSYTIRNAYVQCLLANVQAIVVCSDWLTDLWEYKCEGEYFLLLGYLLYI